MGLLTDEGPPVWHPAQKEVLDACREAARHARSRGWDIASLALGVAVRWVLRGGGLGEIGRAHV